MQAKSRKRTGKGNMGILLLVGVLFLFLGNRQEVLAVKEAETEEKRIPGTAVTRWEEDAHLSGLFDRSTLYFQVGKWDVEEVELELKLMISQLINREVSYISILLDGEPVETVSIPEHRNEMITYRSTFGAGDSLEEGTHSVTVEAYLRGQTTDACVDDSSISAWMNLLADSQVTIRYQWAGTIADIAEFYKKFVSLEALDGKLSMVMTKEGAGDGVLTAMAKVVSGFAQNAKGKWEEIQVGLLGKEGNVRQAPYVIYLDRYDRLPDFLSRRLTETQKRDAQSGGLLCLLEEEGTYVLLITGSNDAALQKAGELLSNPDWIPALTQKTKQIKGTEDYRTAPYQWNEYIPLTSFGTQIKGNFEQSASFGFECPTNRKLAASAQLSLDYRYSANLDFNKSLLTVSINGIPIGSRMLTAEGTDGTTALFTIPQDIGILGNYTVETRFALYPKGEWCELTAEEIPWAYISDTSMLKWTTTENTEVFFEGYPFPFLQDGAFSDVKILLPEEWEKGDLEVMAGVLLTLGKWQKSNRGALAVSSKPDSLELTNANVISIGVMPKNHIFQLGNWQGKTELFQTAGNRGYALLTMSPYGSLRHGALILTGNTVYDMKKNLNFLGQYDRIWEVKGDYYSTDGEMLRTAYLRQPEVKAEHPQVELPADGKENVPLIFVLSVLVLILLAAAMLLIKHGRRT